MFVGAASANEVVEEGKDDDEGGDTEGVYDGGENADLFGFPTKEIAHIIDYYCHGAHCDAEDDGIDRREENKVGSERGRGARPCG